MTVECDKNNYMSITLKKFSYQWGSLFNTNINEGIDHFQIQIRNVKYYFTQFEFGLKEYLPIYEDHKDEEMLKMKSIEEIELEKEKDKICGHIYIVAVKKKKCFKYSFSSLRAKLFSLGNFIIFNWLNL